MTRCDTNNDAELEAILLALVAFPGEPLTILTDSQVAIENLRWSAHLYTESSSVLSDIHRHAAGRVVDVRWVPGHAGDALNTAAHRIALTVYRHSTRGTDSWKTPWSAAALWHS